MHDGLVLTPSPALIEWLEERCPTPPLPPAHAEQRARVRALAASVGGDIHPVNNRRVLEALRKDFGADDAAVHARCGRWIADGFAAGEAMLADEQRRGGRGDDCVGPAPSLADVHLVRQVESARRFKVDMASWPRIAAVDAACAALPAFGRAAPARQPDAG